MVVYTKPNCPACEQLKRKLTTAGTPFTVIDVTTVPGLPQRLRELGYRSVPIVLDAPVTI